MKNQQGARQASQLTVREWELLERLARGSNVKEIAAELFGVDDEEDWEPEATVLTHFQSILQKLQVRFRLETAAFGRRHRGQFSVPQQPLDME
jgi:DNA-binding NarL/FixJ family response regulator